MKINKERALPIIMSALREDVGAGDITGAVVLEKDINVTANIIAKEQCILCGVDVVKWVFDTIDERMIFNPLHKDGDRLKKNKRVASLKGSARNILTGERSALNFLARLSGISTLTGSFVEKLKGSKASIFDTRKTIPGLRELEKYAVKIGGGSNHRMGLWDQVLIKDNHLALCSMEDAIKKAKARHYKDIEVEVDDLNNFKVALEAGADIIMLDNMKIEDLRKAVRLNKKKKGPRPLLEYSGGVRLEDVAKIAKTGVDRISVGFLTHSTPSIDFSLEICT